VSDEAWDGLVAAALVGTARRPLPEATRADVDALLGADLAGVGTERSVLVAAGVLATHRRAGPITPSGGDGRPTAAPDDARPEPSAGALALLRVLLDGAAGTGGPSPALVGAWLGRVAATGRVLPTAALPDLLAYASRTTEVRAALLAAGGPRLGWLAARNPAWRWAAGGADRASDAELAATWRTGTGEARATALAALRTRDPEAGRAVLEDTWAGERAADRVRAVEVVAAGAVPGDEPLLEAALDDRAASVRAAAAEALTRLPTSALGARMATRLRALVVVGGAGRTIELSLPDEPDAAARRDGIGDAAPPGTGLRTWWAAQVVAAAPLRTWTDDLGLTPDRVAGLLDAHPELRDPLVAAVTRQADARWAEALVAVRLDVRLLALHAPERAQLHAERALRRAADPAVGGILAGVSAPWSPAFTRTAIARLSATTNTIVVGQGLGPIAAAGHPDALEDFERWIDHLGDTDRIRRAVRSVAHDLSLRRSILEEMPCPTTSCGPTPRPATPPSSPPWRRPTTAPARPAGGSPRGPSSTTSSARPSRTAPRWCRSTSASAASSSSPWPPSPPTGPCSCSGCRARPRPG
jgi:hypothetical protein